MDFIYADLDKIVYEDRETSYGGFQIRANANRHLIRAALIAFLVFLTITALPRFIAWFSPAVDFPELEIVTEIPTMVDPPPIPEDMKVEPMDVPPSAPPPPTQPVQQLAFLVANPTPENMVQDEEMLNSMDDIEDAKNLGLTNEEGLDEFAYDWNGAIGDGDGLLEAFQEEEKKIDEDDMWLLPDGLQREPIPVDIEGFRQSVGYPELARENGIYGKVTFRVQVDEHGRYVRHKVLSENAHSILVNAVAAKISELRFLPAIQNNRPIKLWVTIPVTFRLQK